VKVRILRGDLHGVIRGEAPFRVVTTANRGRLGWTRKPVSGLPPGGPTGSAGARPRTPRGGRDQARPLATFRPGARRGDSGRGPRRGVAGARRIAGVSPGRNNKVLGPAGKYVRTGLGGSVQLGWGAGMGCMLRGRPIKETGGNCVGAVTAFRLRGPLCWRY